jgi:hypothetical protein
MAIVATPQLFAILAQTNHDQIGAALSAKFPNSYLVLSPGQWLLVAGGVTTKEVSDLLGITAGEAGTAVVIAGTGSYFGRTNPGVWEWLKSRLGVPSGG